MPQVEITTDDMADIEALHTYLVAEGLVGVRPALRPGVPGPGTQGAQEILEIVFTSGGGLALAHAVTAWVRTRQRTITLKLKGKDGSETSFEASGPDAAENLKAILDAQPPS